MSIASRSARPDALPSNGVSHSSSDGEESRRPRGPGHCAMPLGRGSAPVSAVRHGGRRRPRAWRDRAASLQCRMRQPRGCGPGPGGRRWSPGRVRRGLRTRRGPGCRGGVRSRARRSSRVGSQDRVATRSTRGAGRGRDRFDVGGVEGGGEADAAVLSGGGRAAAGGVEFRRPRGTPRRPAVRPAGQPASSPAPQPEPSPAAGLARCGPDRPAPAPVPGRARRPVRRRDDPTRRASSVARRRAAATAAPSACGWRTSRSRSSRRRTATSVSISSGRPRSTSRSSSSAARAQAVPPRGRRPTAAPDHHAGQAGMQREFGHRPAGRGRAAVGVEGAEEGEEAPALLQGPGRRRVEERQPGSPAVSEARRPTPPVRATRPARSAPAISGSGNGRRAACSIFDHRR